MATQRLPHARRRVAPFVEAPLDVAFDALRRDLPADVHLVEWLPKRVDERGDMGERWQRR